LAGHHRRGARVHDAPHGHRGDRRRRKRSGSGEDIFAGLARIGGANALNQVLGGTLGIIVLAILFDTFFNVLGKLTTSRGIRD
jgi:hypothetical protein